MYNNNLIIIFIVYKMEIIIIIGICVGSIFITCCIGKCYCFHKNNIKKKIFQNKLINSLNRRRAIKIADFNQEIEQEQEQIQEIRHATNV